MASKSTRSRKKTSGRPTPSGGRVTPKGGHRAHRQSHAKPDDDTDWSAETSRYTAPTPASAKESPAWWPVLMFGLIGLGILLIVVDYAGLLPGTPNNWMLVPALLCIAGGLFAAMSYR
ncbi:MAG TPA: cell division protein CrgA [Acidimicrobiales bacterium]|nr:cell division protein CrgA [Acidimicrobiales bacterium]